MKSNESLNESNGAVQEWELGVDLGQEDNLLDNITFHELILTVHCNCRTIDEKSVRRELENILEIKKTDMYELLERNIWHIIAEAKKGREQ